MYTPSYPPTKRSLWNKISHALGGPRGLRKHEIALVGLVVLGLTAALVIDYMPNLVSSTDPGPGWTKPETLPEVKPIWTEGVDASKSAVIHDDVLVVSDSSMSKSSTKIYDLTTGEKIMTSGSTKYSWISGNNLVTVDYETDENATVHDIRTGEESRTIKLDSLAHVAVTSGTLVTVEENTDDDRTRMRGIDISTGDTLWTNKLTKPWSDYNLDSPTPPGNASRLDNVPAESDSPIVLLAHEKEDERLDAIDVATGKKRWSSDISDDPELADASIQLTDDNDLYWQTEDGTSYIIDADTGETTEYPAPQEDLISDQDDPLLQGNLLVTTDDSQPAIVDITTEKTVWRSENPDDAVAFRGGVYFESVTYEPEDPAELEVQGTRAIDVESGKTLWTRQELGGIQSVAADTVVTNGNEIGKDRKASTQIFDRETGNGRFQLDGRQRLVAHDDEYLVFITARASGFNDLSVVPQDG